MLQSKILTFVHGDNYYTLYTISKKESYVTHITYYCCITDTTIIASPISSDLFVNHTEQYIDEHIAEWFENAPKTPNI